MKEAVIVSGNRTPIGTLGKTLKDISAEQLSSLVIEDIMQRTNIKGHLIDEVILGQTKQSADAPNIARVAALKAGIPEEIPSYTVHRQCASGMQAIINGYLQIISGFSDIVLAGGVESMSTAPFYVRNGRFGFGSGNTEFLDSNTESQPRSQPSDIYGEFTMIETAENLAKKYGITRQEQDEFALSSQHKAINAIDQGKFVDEIVPVMVPSRKGKITVFKEDEYPRRDTNIEKLSNLRTIYKGGTVTAGNASGRNDGASAVLIMTKEKAKELNLRPIVRIVGAAASGVDPRFMGIGPVISTRKLLKNTNLSMDDLGLIELNEAFAAQTLACVKELNIDLAKLNVNGGAIALGHPLGCSGTRISVTLINEMIKQNIRYGLATICVAGGLGVSIIYENMQI
jgi:acetyl-CoA C-acetyltransferase